MTESKEEPTTSQQKGITAEEFVDKLRRALRRDGDFPASARVVAELRELVTKPDTTANQITEVILREPSLGTRVLHLVNSSFYRRARPIMTVSQAVVQIGMRPLAELCSGLVLLQKFVPAARKGGVFAKSLKQTITTSLLSSSITGELQNQGRVGKDEQGYLAGTFYELGMLLVSFYFPKMYEAALRRSDEKKQSLSQSIQELTGLTPVQLSLEVIDELKLPEFYREVLSTAETPETATTLASEGSDSEKHTAGVAQALYAAHEISSTLTQNGTKEELDNALVKIRNSVDLENVLLSDVIGQLVTRFQDHCASMDLHLPALPTYVRQYTGADAIEEDFQDSASQQEGDIFAQFVEEIREAVDNREPTASIITTVMETFAWSLRFDRVLLMLVASGKQRLVGRMLLGNVPDFVPKDFIRLLGREAGPYAPDAAAVAEARPIFSGEPLFEDGWPFAVVPIGFGKRVIGVIYADRIDSGTDAQLSGREQAAIGVLAELLDRSISGTN
ncbi:MAG: HDOD domain-containing protein [Bdellovibrionales bacterium]|nr:HDOD domain-containing protein [Bdellovibrionales bacterium]